MIRTYSNRSNFDEMWWLMSEINMLTWCCWHVWCSVAIAAAAYNPVQATLPCFLHAKVNETVGYFQHRLLLNTKGPPNHQSCYNSTSEDMKACTISHASSCRDISLKAKNISLVVAILKSQEIIRIHLQGSNNIQNSNVLFIPSGQFVLHQA